MVGEADDRLETLDQNVVGDQTAGSTHGAGEPLVREGSLEEIEELGAVDETGGGDGDGGALACLLCQGLHLDAAETRRDDGAELGGSTDTDKELGGEAADIGIDELADQDTGESGPQLGLRRGRVGIVVLILLIQVCGVRFRGLANHRVESAFDIRQIFVDDPDPGRFGLVDDVG